MAQPARLPLLLPSPTLKPRGTEPTFVASMGIRCSANLGYPL